ncbi:hypothetical protein CKO13_12270, partial [Halorhodospira neutriphila]|nr:hypothetical protein [Halorhodospira neutriphila]
MDIERLRLAGRTAGRARLRLIPGEEALYLREASLHGRTVDVVASGAWRDGRTTVSGRLQAGDVAQLLALLGAPPAVAVAEVDLVAELDWPGPPWAVRAERLGGRLRLAMDEGRITEVDPGAGRLVGLLGLRMLPRRILLDFRDLFGEGFAFDKLKGRIEAVDGIAKIDRLRIAGPAARVMIEG